MKLTPWGDTVLRKWEQSKPNLVKQLREKGRLKEVVDDLGKQVKEDVIELEDKLREQHPNKGVGTEDYLKAVQRENEIAQQAKEVVFQSHGLNEPESEETTESPFEQQMPEEDEVLLPKHGEISRHSNEDSQPTEGNQSSAGFNPKLFELGTKAAAFHIEAGARSFADFSRRMINDVGEKIKPYLKTFYKAAREMPGTEDFRHEMDSDADVDAFDLSQLDKESPEQIYFPELAKEREALEKELRDLRKAWTNEKDKKLEQLRSEIRELKNNHEAEKERLRKNKKRREELEPEIEKKKNRIEEKRQEFYDLQKEDPESIEDDTCPTCGQYLPESKLEEARDKARRDLANRMKDINKTGKRLNNELMEDRNEHYALGDKNQEIEEALPQKEQALRDKEAEYEALQVQKEDTDAIRKDRKSQIQSRLDEIREIEDSTEAPPRSSIS